MHKLFYLVLFLFLGNLVYADGYWLELEGSGKKGDLLAIKIRYGGVSDSKERYIKSGHDLDKMKGFTLTVIDPDGKTTDISIRQEKDYWLGSYIPKMDGTYHIYAVNNQLPVVERDEQKNNIRPVQYLHTVYVIAKNTEQPIKMPYLNVEVKIKHKLATVFASIDGRPVKKDTPLRVFLPDNHDIRINTDENGTASFPLASRGRYLIRLDQYIPHEDVFEGKQYFSERHRCDYSLTY
ncbi:MULTISPECIES: hypothetical protein [Chryseobacterium]|uniref:DUF4198 domain-containing protein n=1 Tax=Chryseobacterium camelliae TaxID=1265445 RepID=A0ABU0TFN8_9FLAO|nr:MULTISPECIES: hypothetical protein [Chryseobacterium]MDT3406325.1 hypothetical protein [Pseudacidovorax intermedius]MDQ1095876.1 hypothetical protein [Chryseobacterium camelliae]MDQ1099813.1 hypothetical protein [Chryseobacterium sp. SORGH_AS_1048]MDR6087159.1 hypothetical protein [Chryseobacterium sp. SORGH_AS_0909]MDR6131532.1 hypothetical protein [Chryseobacterium sp. SORGH_AS_1175]